MGGKKREELGVVVHTFNPTLGGRICEFKANEVYRMSSRIARPYQEGREGGRKGNR